MPRSRIALGRAGVVLAAVLSVTACGTKDRLLTAPDPDLINPGDVNSPDGADALYGGAVRRFKGMSFASNYNATESTWFLGGLLADEYRSGDTFTERDETDRRSVQTNNGNVSAAYRGIHQTRLSANQAIAGLKQFRPTSTANIAEMYLYRGWAEWQSGADFCNGQPFSDVKGSDLLLGTPVSSADAFKRAQASIDSGLVIVGSATDARSVLIRNSLSTIKGRILTSLGQYADALTAVSTVPTTFALTQTYAQTSGDNWAWSLIWSQRRWTVASVDGGNGLNFAGANDPRVPTCLGGSTECKGIQPGTQTKAFDTSTPLVLWLGAPTRDATMTVVSGVEARLIEAEARLKAGDASGSLAVLNTLRATTTLYPCPAATLPSPAINASCKSPVTALTPLADAGDAASRVDQLFRERAFWLFGRGVRLEDSRRLIRQYGRTEAVVFPSGGSTRAYFKGGTYGTDVNFPVPQAEQNNTNFTQCTDRNA